MKIYSKMILMTVALATVLTGCGNNSDETNVKTKGAKSLEAAVETCVSGWMTGNVEKMLSVAPPGVSECLSESCGLTGDKFLEQVAGYSGAFMFAENPSCEVKVTECHSISTGSLSNINQIFSANGYNMAEDGVTAYITAELDDKFANELGLDSSTFTYEDDGLYAFNIEGEWYAITMECLDEALRYWAKGTEY